MFVKAAIVFVKAAIVFVKAAIVFIKPPIVAREVLVDSVETDLDCGSKIDQSVEDVARSWLIHKVTIEYDLCQKMTSALVECHAHEFRIAPLD